MTKINLLIGILSIALLSIVSCGNSQTPTNKESDQKAPKVETAKTETAGKVIQMDLQMFLDKVYDFKTNPNEWVYKSDKPCIIDFYADWCRPCKMIAPYMEEFASTYNGQIDIYKVNTDVQKELAAAFGIRSIPSILFCPTNEKPQMTQGALQKAQYESIINDYLLKK